MFNRPWGGGSDIRRIYEYRDSDKNRMGHCKWLPKTGDLCVCVAHAGDCFFDYVALRKRKNGSWKRVGRFGAYVFGKPRRRLSEKKFHLACAGEPISLS